MEKRWLILAVVIMITGCRRQDSECLSRIGRKLVDRANAATAGFRDKLPGFKVQVVGADSLQDRVLQRLKNEKVLANLTFEVVVSGQEIELKGTVETPEQRTRAIELAEATVGVERVLVSVPTPEPPRPPPMDM